MLFVGERIASYDLMIVCVAATSRTVSKKMDLPCFHGTKTKSWISLTHQSDRAGKLLFLMIRQAQHILAQPFLI